MNISQATVYPKLTQSFSQWNTPGLIWLCLTLLGSIIFFWEGFASLFRAWATPEYSHGYFIPFVAAFLFLWRMKSLPKLDENKNSLPGLSVVVLACCVASIGKLTGIPDIVTYGCILFLAGLIITWVGFSKSLIFWAPWLYLFFMLPLPNFIYWPLSIKLQEISSEIGVAIISLLGVTVFLEGNIIDLGTYKLQVAEACSGLRYLFPLLSFGFIFAVVYRGAVWQKVVLFLSAIPITILMNSFRIGMIGFLVDSYGSQHAEGFLHFFEGWIIFASCIAILYLEAILLQYLSANPQPIGKMFNMDSDGLSAQLKRFYKYTPSKGLVIASALIFLLTIGWSLSPGYKIVNPDRQSFLFFPTQIGERIGIRTKLNRDIERVLAADDYHLANYTRKRDNTSINLFIAYYKSQTQGSGIHSPEVCIPAGGWEVSRWQSVQTKFKLPNGEPIYVNRAIIQKGVQRQLVYYWFKQRGYHLTSDYMVKAYAMWDAIARGRTDGALVRLITPINSSETEGLADERLNDFLGQVLKTLPYFVPK